MPLRLGVYSFLFIRAIVGQPVGHPLSMEEKFLLLLPGLWMRPVIAVPAPPRQLRSLIPLYELRVFDMSVAEKYIGAGIVPSTQVIAIVFVGSR